MGRARTGRVFLLAAVALVTAGACTARGTPRRSPGDSPRQGTTPSTSAPATSPSLQPPASPPSPLRTPTAAEADCLGTIAPSAAVHRAIDKFMGAPHGVVPLSTVHEAGRALGRLVPPFRAHLRAYGPFEGGDVCLGRAASALAAVGTALGPTAEIRLAALWYQLLVEFYPHSPLLGQAEEYLFVQGYIVPSPGSGLHPN